MSAAGSWWPVGDHLLPDGLTLTLEDQMQLQAHLDIAERAADRADDILARARAANLDAEEIDHLREKATAARIAYYDALNADLAQ
ncbi:hypothetical protein [Litoreibacter roseus]|uniref:Uncharacterized protein n=1 Tax=Litoreibacter roseus TaxID=2601869 RepID=A0A6N6JM30_9RHOB|nr:hypothetical protein [Litoreibacter roseus]GFE67027.1 hypothetical protein KIN_41010 [Litoreibacter roseus]